MRLYFDEFIDAAGIEPDPELAARNLERAKEVIRKMGSKYCCYEPINRAAQDEEDTLAAHSHTGEE